MTHVFRCLLCLILWPLATGPAPTHAQSGSACSGAAMPTNVVVRFYLAVDSRRFTAAYGCLAPAQHSRWPFQSWVRGYSRTLQTRLLSADSEVPNGDRVNHVSFQLYGLDLIGGRQVATLYRGRWSIDLQGRLAGVSLQRVAGPAVYSPRRLFTRLQLGVLSHWRYDVTGDRIPENLYLTSGSGCGSCHAQQLWVYRSGKLIFQQQVDDADVLAPGNHAGMEVVTDTPGSAGLDSCCPSKKTHEIWTWTRFGFSLQRHFEVTRKP